MRWTLTTTFNRTTHIATDDFDDDKEIEHIAYSLMYQFTSDLMDYLYDNESEKLKAHLTNEPGDVAYTLTVKIDKVVRREIIKEITDITEIEGLTIDEISGRHPDQMQLFEAMGGAVCE